MNNDFETIIKLLEKYLIEIEEKSTNEINENILLNLEKTIQSNTISVDHLYDLAFSSKQKFIEQGSLDADYTMRKFIDKFFQKDNAYRPDDTLVVNFNYTNTFENYIDKLKNSDLIYIHGKLNDVDNKIIFGFGDEIDSNYRKIEDLNLNNAMNYIKSVQYLKTDNYRKVLDFISLDRFQVFIMGHSCSNTDRTLLNKIFEHDNCKSILTFYYKDNEKNTDNWGCNLPLVRNI